MIIQVFTAQMFSAYPTAILQQTVLSVFRVLASSHRLATVMIRNFYRSDSIKCSKARQLNEKIKSYHASVSFQEYTGGPSPLPLL